MDGYGSSLMSDLHHTDGSAENHRAGWLHCGHRNLFTKLKEGPLLVNTYIHTSKLHLDRSDLSHT